MIFLKYIFLTLILLFQGCVSHREVGLVFTEKDIQSALKDAPKSKTFFDGVMTISMIDSPEIKLGSPNNRVGFKVRLNVRVENYLAMPIIVHGSTNLVYESKQKSFYLSEPVLDKIDVKMMPDFASALMKNKIQERLSNYFDVTPVYIIKDDAGVKQVAYGKFLKYIVIRSDDILAVFSF